MNSILVPSDGDGELSLHAVHFAFEFAKRTGTRVLFLMFGQSPEGGSPPAQAAARSHEAARRLELAISSARLRGLTVSTYVTSGDYVDQVAAFAGDHRVSRVVVALPDSGSGASAQVDEQVTSLRSRLGCVLVTVRPRRDRQAPLLAEHETGGVEAPPPVER